MSPTIIHSASLLLACLALGGGCAPELCVGDCDEGTGDGTVVENELASLQQCNVQSTIDASTCGDGVAQAGEVCFGPGTIITLPGAPHTAIAGDFDADGRTDVLWSDEDGSVMRSGGAAVAPLSASVLVAQVEPEPPPLVLTGVGDFDANGTLDAVGSEDRPVLLPGDGIGGFAPLQLLHEQAVVWGPTVLDANGDGDLDLGLVDPLASPEVIVLDNDGAGGLAPSPQVELVAADFPIVLANLDGVAPLDLVVGDAALTGVGGDEHVLHVLARGPAGDTHSTLSLAADYLRAIDVEARDVDADGRTDLVMGLLDAEHENSQGFLIYQGVAVFLSDGPPVEGSPRFGAGTYLPTDCGSHRLVMGDVDGDDVLDIVSSHYAEPDSGQSASLVVRLGDGLGGFDAVARIPAPVGVEKGGQVLLGDFDGDGRTDVTVFIRTDRQLVLYRGTN